MGHGWGKKLAQNDSKPLKAVTHLALMHCFMTTFNSLQLKPKKYSSLS